MKMLPPQQAEEIVSSSAATAGEAVRLRGEGIGCAVKRASA
jgi:hypothetical protein